MGADYFAAAAQAFQGGFNAMERHKALRADREQGAHALMLREKELDLKKRKLEMELEIERQAQRDDASRYVEAEAAFQKFAEASNSIDWGAEDAPSQYQQAVRTFLPTVLKHESVAQKFESLNRATTTGMAFTARKVAEVGAAQAYNEAAKIAPGLVLNPPKREDGSIDTEAFAAKLEEARKEIYNQAKELANIRRTSTARPAKPTLGPGSKAELSSIEDELREINKQLIEMDRTGLRTKSPDVYLQMVNRKNRIMDKLRGYDEKFAATPDGEATGDDGEAAEVPSNDQGPVDFIWDPRSGKLVKPGAQ